MEGGVCGAGAAGGGVSILQVAQFGEVLAYHTASKRTE